MANNNPAHIVLTNVRLSYVHLDQPHAQNGGEPKFSAVVLLPKADTAGRAKIDAAICWAAEKAREKFGAAFPAQPLTSVHDGDGPRPSDGQPYGEECRGCWVFTASSKQRPGVVDRNLQPILDGTELYSGMYANVGVTFYGYSQPQKKGIGVSLDNVQKIADGEPLGGSRASADDDFGGLAAPAAQPAYAAPAAPAASAYGAPAYPAIDPITGLPV